MGMEQLPSVVVSYSERRGRVLELVVVLVLHEQGRGHRESRGRNFGIIS
jgi:hypothetical protein